MNNNQNLVTEVASYIIAALLVFAAAFLLYTNKIDFTGASLLLGLVAGIFGVTGAFKAPSPSQQTQINAQQLNLQQLLSQVLNVLPSLFAQAQQPIVIHNNIPQAPLQGVAPVVQVPQAIQGLSSGAINAMQGIPPAQGPQLTLMPNTTITNSASSVQTDVPQQPFPINVTPLTRHFGDSVVMPAVTSTPPQ